VLTVIKRDGSHSDPALTMFSANSSDLCLTPTCVKAAAVMLDNMNANANPCDNFYEFMCGGYMEKSIIPQGGSKSYFGDNGDSNRNMIRKG
jgi:membrane metallo-endopeptidase-like protein 1